MSRKVTILDVAKPDFRRIRAYVKAQFGEMVWSEVNLEFKATMKHMGLNPEAGKQVEELADLGLKNFRFRLVRQTKVVYEFDGAEVVVHMFIHTKQDFRTHLMQRLLDT